MGRLLNLLAMGLTLFFWFGVIVSLVVTLPGKLSSFLPICGVIVALMHWVQASMIRAACKPHFFVTNGEFVQVLIFGVFGMRDTRARLKAIVEAGSKPQS
ncbi:DUF1145 domain-containing protein [Aeromonas rivuli]|uniref:DUF1145 domain-containing protein n=1 Tax=Aeromonas rivuli TaxID=648794 RepID=UPI001CCC53D4|nr:DUF1145 domain-containing protein [Aeromonas rivuli]UBO74272.1 DUF1145 domain-containing protein [Aeromonas rivuli]